MVKSVLLALTEYNAYANRVLLETAAMANAKDLEETHSPSRESVLNLIRHMTLVEVGYLAQLQGKPTNVDREAVSILEGIADLAARTDASLKDYLSLTSELELQQTRDVKIGEHPFRFTPWQMLLQVFSHSAAHRGELSILLSEMGYPLPLKDMIIRFAEESGQEWPWK